MPADREGFARIALKQCLAGRLAARLFERQPMFVGRWPWLGTGAHVPNDEEIAERSRWYFFNGLLEWEKTRRKGEPWDSIPATRP